ncbi:MAG: YicC family protein [Bdellovibrionaceae bacterium]|nr:YicC family protein [Pseudobdellovibrionaceae bacterium]
MSPSYFCRGEYLLRSMTGFGAARGKVGGTTLEVSIRAVNGRFLETRFHLPREYHPFEGDLRAELESELRRGTVDVFVDRKCRSRGEAIKISLNETLAKSYAVAYRRLAKIANLASQVHLDSIARWPGVLMVEEDSKISGAERELVLKTFRSALSSLVKERKREGQALRRELLQLLGLLEKEVENINRLRGEANSALQERFEQKIRNRLGGAEIDQQRLSQEIVIQLEKADISEEIVRLREHCRNYRSLLTQEDGGGKKLDFYTQELLREINTIGSKSQLAQVTQCVVEAKTIIERLREQVQNIE